MSTRSLAGRDAGRGFVEKELTSRTVNAHATVGQYCHAMQKLLQHCALVTMSGQLSHGQRAKGPLPPTARSTLPCSEAEAAPTTTTLIPAGEDDFQRAHGKFLATAGDAFRTPLIPSAPLPSIRLHPPLSLNLPQLFPSLLCLFRPGQCVDAPPLPLPPPSPPLSCCSGGLSRRLSLWLSPCRVQIDR